VLNFLYDVFYVVDLYLKFCFGKLAKRQLSNFLGINHFFAL